MIKDVIRYEVAESVIHGLQAKYSKEKQKVLDNHKLVAEYELMQDEFKKVAQFLVTADDDGVDLVIEKYGKLYRENLKRLDKGESLITEFQGISVC